LSGVFSIVFSAKMDRKRWNQKNEEEVFEYPLMEFISDRFRCEYSIISHRFSEEELFRMILPLKQDAFSYMRYYIDKYHSNIPHFIYNSINYKQMCLLMDNEAILLIDKNGSLDYGEKCSSWYCIPYLDVDELLTVLKYEIKKKNKFHQTLVNELVAHMYA